VGGTRLSTRASVRPHPKGDSWHEIVHDTTPATIAGYGLVPAGRTIASRDPTPDAPTWARRSAHNATKVLRRINRSCRFCVDLLHDTQALRRTAGAGLSFVHCRTGLPAFVAHARARCERIYRRGRLSVALELSSSTSSEWVSAGAGAERPSCAPELRGCDSTTRTN
jgi:hypothetical protein